MTSAATADSLPFRDGRQVMARITLEDLSQLDDELMEDVALQEQPPEDDEQSQLFSHWEVVASTHQVSLPHDMAAPISEMTRNREIREAIPYVLLSQNEKCTEEAYEERQYPAGKWACVRKQEPLYEQSTSLGFMKLMRYICKENSTGCYLGMTVPVLSRTQIAEDGITFVGEISTEYYLPAEFQQDPPLPQDPEILIMDRAPFQVITRNHGCNLLQRDHSDWLTGPISDKIYPNGCWVIMDTDPNHANAGSFIVAQNVPCFRTPPEVFYGRTTEETILREIGLLWELLGDTDTVLRGTYLVASYQNPGVPHRRNEIWFIRGAS